jgi:hypothetical protein
MKKLESNAVDRIVNETRLSLIFNESHKQAAKRIQNALNIGRNRQHDQNASALWRYFQSVITWVSTTFTEKIEMTTEN